MLNVSLPPKNRLSNVVTLPVLIALHAEATDTLKPLQACAVTSLFVDAMVRLVIVPPAGAPPLKVRPDPKQVTEKPSPVSTNSVELCELSVAAPSVVN